MSILEVQIPIRVIRSSDTTMFITGIEWLVVQQLPTENTCKYPPMQTAVAIECTLDELPLPPVTSKWPKSNWHNLITTVTLRYSPTNCHFLPPTATKLMRAHARRFYMTGSHPGRRRIRLDLGYRPDRRPAPVLACPRTPAATQISGPGSSVHFKFKSSNFQSASVCRFWFKVCLCTRNSMHSGICSPSALRSQSVCHKVRF